MKRWSNLYCGPKMAPLARIWDRINKCDYGCWEWTGPVSHGYGIISIGRNSSMHVHRAAWITINGPIPKGKSVLHKCDNRRCARLDHLFLGTQADNMKDMANKGRSLKGNENPARVKPVKLNWEKVREIRKLHSQTGIGPTELARKFNLNSGYMSRLLRGERWGMEVYHPST